MKKLILACYFAGTLTLFGQQRIYFDSDWEVTTQKNAAYYRETTQEGGLTHIRDYYLNGTLQMDGLASDANPSGEVYEGKVTWYRPDGSVESFSNYKNGSRTGEGKSYDERGRVTSEQFYSSDDKYTGKTYEYKDPGTGSYYNSITEFTSDGSYKTVVYDNDIRGIRSETQYNGKTGETKDIYYGDGGKKLGEQKYSSEGTVAKNTVEVTYTYNPMRVESITRYKRNADEPYERTRYYKNGKIKSSYRRNGSSAAEVFYNSSGAKTADLQYKETDGSLMPYTGTLISYYSDEGKEDMISIETLYKDGEELQIKNYSSSGQISQIIDYAKSENSDFGSYEIEKETFFDAAGNQKSVLEYQDGQPYNGISYEDGYTEYRNGVLWERRNFFENGTLSLEKKRLPDNRTLTTVYNLDGKMRHQLKSTDNSDEGYSAEVTTYYDGKPKKAVIENSILKSGKIKYLSPYTYQDQEMERSGNWIIIRERDEKGTLTKETKILVASNAEEIQLYEALLLSVTESEEVKL